MPGKTSAATIKVLYYKTFILTLFFPLLFLYATAQSGYSIQQHEAPPIKSIRGMNVLPNGVIWLSGTEGKVGISTDYGEHWTWITVPGYDTCDWRSLVAFNDKRALLLNAGEPAHLLLTTDGGANWKEVYTNHTKGVFFDGMAFRNAKEGIAIGDPIDGRFTIIRTKDSGNTWQADPFDALPVAKEGEAIFAASGTSVRIMPNGEACFITGGNISRFISGWRKWTPVEWRFIHGSPGTGAFSVAFADKQHGVAVGGDYTRDTVTTGNCLITRDGGRIWQPVITPPDGYRSCIQFIGHHTFVATGTSGTDISEDGGLNWHKISQEGYHVAGIAPSGNRVWLAGSKKLASFGRSKL
ncbi:WD40/YVTN/BNR-like repeat-containing protein [Chitinophaga ginsengisoli]|uniref:Photosystem II stability/assembly factor-like uncharacterized protein n=1 Tax=Chitinophaga ginsengisoli TaxID=363837 RepID=A0A2P8FNW2_9BACT|nr:oxidoreductase [Chitinophaga ginsengisoli]PSL23412.1 photosystem II stability/assembly factor-like uncharacterized protein [Chitinophaga ginsengisoli]